VELFESLPELDHIDATSKIKSEGVIKRVIDIFSYFRSKGQKLNSIYAPTRTIQMIK
jgi:hypothetical protein